jgi:branched-chain amino acid transport system substrate-binding protein
MLKEKVLVTTLCAAMFGTMVGAGSAQADSTKALTIGVIESISGWGAPYGEAHHKGTQLALEEINHAGGLDGKPIVFYTEDDRTDPAVGIDALKRLITERNVDVIVGSNASLVTLAISNESEKYKIPIVIGQASLPAITQQGNQYTWRIALTDAQLDTKIIEYYLSGKGMKRFAFLVENSDYGKLSTKAAAEKIKELGGTVTAYEEYNLNDTDFKAKLARIKDSNPEVVYVYGHYPEGAVIARQLKELGIKAQLIVNRVQGLKKFAELSGEASDGTVFPTTWLPGLPDERSKKFESAFKAKYGSAPGQNEAGSYGVGAYEAIYTVVEAAKLGGGTSSEQIQEGLKRLKDFNTMLGPINFDSKNQNNGSVRLATFSGGKIVPLK